MAKMPFCGVLQILPDTHRVPEFYHDCETWMMNICHCYRSWEGFVVTAPLNTFAQLSISCFAGRVFGQVSENANVDFPTKPICILDCGLLLLDVHTQTLSKTPKDTNRHTKSHKDTHSNTKTHTATQRYTQTHTDTHRHTRTHTDTHIHTKTHKGTDRYMHTHILVTTKKAPVPVHATRVAVLSFIAAVHSLFLSLYRFS